MRDKVKIKRCKGCHNIFCRPALIKYDSQGGRRIRYRPFIKYHYTGIYNSPVVLAAEWNKSAGKGGFCKNGKIDPKRLFLCIAFLIVYSPFVIVFVLPLFLIEKAGGFLSGNNILENIVEMFLVKPLDYLCSDKGGK